MFTGHLKVQLREILLVEQLARRFPFRFYLFIYCKVAESHPQKEEAIWKYGFLDRIFMHELLHQKMLVFTDANAKPRHHESRLSEEAQAS